MRVTVGMIVGQIGAGHLIEEILAITRGKKPSIVQIRSDNRSLDVIGARTIHALRQLVDQFSEGALVTVDPMRTRVRSLN